MLRDAIRAVWNEPRVATPSAVPWWDRALVLVLVPIAIAEGVLRDEVPWPPFTIVLSIVAVLAILGRSQAPLTMTMLAFGAQTLAGLGPVWAGLDYDVLYVTACILLFPYSLGRWAQGRDIAIGLTFLVVLHVVREPQYGESVTDVVLGLGFLMLPAALGVSVRFWHSARERERSEIRLREREQLARELHDTVAHHVSGIVIQAQAGRAVGTLEPGRSVEVLANIEHAATQTMTEMRSLVGVLRDGAPAERAPAKGLADLGPLVRQHQGVRAVLHTSGDVAQLGSAIEGVIYRLVQESLTNARIHARDATMIEVHVATDEAQPAVAHDRAGEPMARDSVRVSVTDDGRPVPRSRRRGFGLIGMAERVDALGGTMRSGPQPGNGWRVAATIPITVRRS